MHRKISSVREKYLKRQSTKIEISSESDEMETVFPERRKEINVAILGAVSAGKSTLMNTIFVRQFSSMKIKRTTMTPQVYKEIDKLNEDLSTEEIKKRNDEINKNLQNKIDKKELITLEDISEAEYYVKRVKDLCKLKKNVFLSVYDIPGINDGHTESDVYKQYVNEKFKNFDIVIFVVDINSALNTKDEVEILDMILEGIKTNKVNYNIDTSLIIIANKCDDMFLNDEKQLSLDEEMEDMFNQIKKITENKMNDKKLDVDVDYVRLSAEDAFIYRVYGDNPKADMDMKYINKLGWNEFGKSGWNKKTEKEKRDKMIDLFKKIDIKDSMRMSGFTHFSEVFKKCLSEEKQVKYLMNHLIHSLDAELIKYKADKTHDIAEYISFYEDAKMKVFEINKLYSVDEMDTFNSRFSKFVKEYYDYIQTICKKISDLNIDVIKESQDTINYMCSNFYYNCPDLKDYHEELVNDINNWYKNQIESRSRSISDNMVFLTRMLNNGWKDFKSLVNNVFSNSNMFNVTSDQFIENIEEMYEKNLITEDEKIEKTVKFLEDLYMKVNSNTSMTYVVREDFGAYSFSAYNIFFRKNKKELNKLLYILEVNKIKYMTADNYKDIEPRLEKYLINIIGDRDRTDMKGKNRYAVGYA